MHPSTVPTTGSARTTTLRGLAGTASVLVWVAVLGPLSMSASSLSFGWSQHTAPAQIGMALMGGGLVFNLLSFLVAGVVVLVWLSRARANADALYPAPHRLAAGWAVGGWFVPIGNLVIPMIVVTDVVKASNPAGRSIPECGLWWTGWIGGNLALPMASLLLVSTGGRGGAGVLAISLLLAALLYGLAAFSFRRIALNVARWQDEAASADRLS
jgi:hypothetical protein